MDSLVDDDICILADDKEDCMKTDQDPPLSASSGEASVASHFALVTAYEDIKKRLKDTERENLFLKKRLRQMEEKLCENRAEQGMGESDKVNKAYSAFREICIERDFLKKKLIALEEKIECTRSLNEQLQSKEVELLQVKSELETHQVIKSLSKTPTDWEIEKLNSELKIRSLEQEVKLLQEECGCLQEELQRTKKEAADTHMSAKEHNEDKESECERSMQQAYWELKKEMSNLHLVTEVQAEVLRKLKGTVSATKKASHGPVQCEDDLEKSCGKLHITASGVTYEKIPSVLPKEHQFCEGASAFQPHGAINTLYEKTDCTQWTRDRPIPLSGADCEDKDSYQKSSFEENSWVMPSPPKPSDTLFWEAKIKSPANNMGHYYEHSYTFNS